MRKVLSFVLVLSLVLGSFGMAFAATTPGKTTLSDIDGLDCEDAVRVLTSLNVVSGYEDGTYRPEQTVTRAEMASLLINALGLKETNAIPKFTDSVNHWAKGYIAYANTLGIISGRSETIFDPDATVTYDEATTMIIKALGYNDDCLVGTYPASYVSRAKVLGILDGIQTGSAGANRGDIAIMLYQTLDKAIGKVDKDGNFVETGIEWNNSGVAIAWDTMLVRLGAKMYDVNGYYDADDKNFIVTGDEDTLINLTPYKGALVSAYMNTDKEIIAIKEIFSTFVSGTIDDDVLTAADGTEYTLKADALADIGATTTASAVMFDNGDEVAAFTVMQDESVNYTLSAKVSGKKLDEVYSVLRWRVTNDDVLEAEDLTDIETNHKLLGVEFAEDNNDDIDLDSFDIIGADSLDDIKADMVAYVYKNADGKIARVAVGPVERVSGEVTKVNNAGDKITIDGTAYQYASVELAGNGGPGEVGAYDIEAGDEVELTLDAYGYIYDSEDVGGKADKFAVVLDLENKDGTKISSDAKVKLFLADGTNKVFTVDEDEVGNDAIITSDSGIWNASITSGAIVKYGLDKDGVITSLIAADEDDLVFDVATSKVNKNGYFASKTVATNAVLFNYSATGFVSTGALSTDEDDYGVLTYDGVLDSDTTDAKYVYDSKKKEIVAMLLNDVSASEDVFGVVNAKGKNNSDAGAYYDMLIDGKEVTYNGTDGSGSNKYGVLTDATSPLYMIKFDANGDIKSFEAWSDGTDEKYMATVGAVSTGSLEVDYNNRTFTVSGGSINLTAANGASSLSGTTASSITLSKTVIVYVYDGEWTLGSSSDLRNMEDGQSVSFYDVYDEDGVFDIAMIVKP